MENKTIKCIKDIVFNGITYAKKGDMVKIDYVGVQMYYTGTNGMLVSMSVGDSMKYFDNGQLKALFK